MVNYVRIWTHNQTRIPGVKESDRRRPQATHHVGGPPAGHRRVGHSLRKSMATPCHTPMPLSFIFLWLKFFSTDWPVNQSTNQLINRDIGKLNGSKGGRETWHVTIRGMIDRWCNLFLPVVKSFLLVVNSFFYRWWNHTYHKIYCRHKPANQLLHCFWNIGSKGANLLCSFVCPSFICPSVRLSACPSAFLSIPPSVCPSDRLSAHSFWRGYNCFTDYLLTLVMGRLVLRCFRQLFSLYSVLD